MTQQPVIVVGGGTAGIAAALAAAQAQNVVLLDEQPALPANVSRLNDAGVDVRSGTSVWALLPGPRVAVFDVDHSWEVDASAVVLATGAVDVAWPVPGWHLEGVVTPRALPGDEGRERLADGRRFGIIGAGEDVRNVVEQVGRSGGTVVMETSDIAGVRIEGEDRVERLVDAEQTAEVDAVVIAFGQRPDPTLALQARAKSAFDRHQYVEMPLVAADGATSLPGVFVAGAAAGMSTHEAATSHGEVAGRVAAAVAAGGTQSIPSHAPRLGATHLPLPNDPGTIICRDQMVDLRTVRAAIDRGAYDVNDLRRQTRAGMGPTQGRDTLPVLAALMMQAHPDISDERLIARVRPPARPLPFRVALNHRAGD